LGSTEKFQVIKDFDLNYEPSMIENFVTKIDRRHTCEVWLATHKGLGMMKKQMVEDAHPMCIHTISKKENSLFLFIFFSFLIFGQISIFYIIITP
jgi:hypothetical protein